VKAIKTLKIGSLIHVKAEYEERYIILHKYPFPGVLDRLRKSHLSHYSIFLLNSLLFSYYEYNGSDYEEDMNKISLDPITRDWWKLTDPMQDPLPDRKDNEWWSSIEELLSFSCDPASEDFPSRRFAFTLRIKSESLLRDLVSSLPSDTPRLLSRYEIQSLSLFLQPPSHIFVYGEYMSPDFGQLFSRFKREPSLQHILQSFRTHLFEPESALLRLARPMTEVFHMD